MSDPAVDELRRRAARLAEPPARPEPTDALDVLTFTWAGARYVISTAHVCETVRARRLARVPGAAPPLLGACTVRSEALPVVDLRPLLGLPSADRQVVRLVVLEHDERACLALAADVVERIITLRPADLHEPADRPAFVRAVTLHGASLLDAEVLLDLPPFFRTTEGSDP